MPDSYLLVWTTASSEVEAQKIAQHLVEKGLAACVQVDGPITSTYRWEGAVESSREWRCSIKTHMRHLKAVEQAIQACHSYQVPQFVAIPIAETSPAYRSWMESVLAP